VKYLAPCVFFLVGSEVISWAVLLVLAGMFLGDIVKEGKWRI
jgi:hypothetical protein